MYRYVFGFGEAAGVEKFTECRADGMKNVG